MKNLLIITIIIPFNLLSQYTNIPDENFELALLNLGYDFVIDGVVETSTIDTITILQINGNNISDLTGIEDFTSLQSLFCYDNNIMNLNLSNNSQLFEVTCSDNQLTYINLKNGNNTGLWYFMSFNNPNLMCIDVDDVSYCEYTFAVDTWTSFSNNCIQSNIHSASNIKKLIKITDIHGRESNAKLNTPLIYIYSDGTIEKRIFLK